MRQRLALALHQLRLAQGHRDRHRHQQGLQAQAFAIEGRFQFLVVDALVRGVHVHHYQTIGVLGQDVDAMQLRDGIAERRDLALFGHGLRGERGR